MISAFALVDGLTGLNNLASLARVLLEVASVLELRAHIARLIAIATALAKPAWLTRLLRSLALQCRWTAGVRIIVVVCHVAELSLGSRAVEEGAPERASEPSPAVKIKMLAG